MIDPAIATRITHLLEQLYGDQAANVAGPLFALIDKYQQDAGHPDAPRWTERDVTLITYGDQVSQPGESPLATLKRFLLERQLDRCINAVHLLPFCPYSSDDGFSVIDYRQIDSALGTWDDVRRLAEHFDLMFDLVLNHASQHSPWFQDYLAGNAIYSRYFIEVDPNEDLSAVTRPRSLPLLTAFDTNRGTKHLWTTFSADQIDLNFSEPQCLLEMLDIFLLYLRNGARMIRLDAIAYLWKEIGTSCIHLPQTHAVVKLMRAVVDAVAPRTILLTETNVPHAENVSYFGDGDEAHMVYQFSLPPLLLEAALSEDAVPLSEWLAKLEAAKPDTTYFNFTASHDGVGVRPLEGLIEPSRLDRLIESVKIRGGHVSTKRNSDGSDSPYELNITYLGALSNPGVDTPQDHARRFLATQAIMLALRGIPGVYFHSLVGTPNDLAAVEATGIPRRINRRKFELHELSSAIDADGSTQQLVFRGYQQLLKTRIQQSAFHPDASQLMLPTDDASLLAFRRHDPISDQAVLVVANLSRHTKTFDIPPRADCGVSRDLLSNETVINGNTIRLQPFHVAWLC